MNRMECPACTSSTGRKMYEVNGFAIWKCTGCGTLYVRNVPERGALDQIYTDDEYYDLDDEAVERINTDHRRRLEILKALTNSRRVLDVGCTTGLFLDEAARAGYETFGIELSPKNAAIARQKGHDVFLGSLEKFTKDYPQERFELIVCLDVIEHIECPAEFMRLLSQCLSPDGILVMSTPNYSGPISRILGRRDVFLTPPEHLNFFTFPGLLKLARDVGLSPVYKTTFGRLTRNELDRATTKYFPKIVQPLNQLLRVGIQAGITALNYLRAGLEIEVYFSKSG